MLQRFLRRDQDDPYLDLHRDAHGASVYDEDETPLLKQPRVKLIAGGAVALTLMAVLFGGGGNDGTSIPVINPPTPTTRIKPTDPEGMELPHKDMQVYSYVDPNGVPQPKVERLIPAPQDAPILPPKPAAPPPSTPVATAPVAPSPVANVPQPSLTPPQRQPGVPGSLQPVAIQPMPTTLPQRPTQPQTTAQVQPQRPPAVVTPAPQTAVAPQTAPAVVAPAPAVVAPPAPQPTASIPPSAPVSSGGSFRLQLGSLRDMAAAQQHWKLAQTRGGAILAGLQPNVLQVDIPGKGTYFRVQAGSWPSRQDAQQACDSLKQARVECMVVRQTP